MWRQGSPPLLLSSVVCWKVTLCMAFLPTPASRLAAPNLIQTWNLRRPPPPPTLQTAMSALLPAPGLPGPQLPALSDLVAALQGALQARLGLHGPRLVRLLQVRENGHVLREVGGPGQGQGQGKAEEKCWLWHHLPVGLLHV